jgi:hypothetical protein
MPLNISGSIINSAIVSTLNYKSIVTRGLSIHFDASAKDSYPETGTTWTDLVTSTAGVLTNGPTYSTDGGGSISFDGTNDYSYTSNISTSFPGGASLEMWVNLINRDRNQGFIDYGGGGKYINFYMAGSGGNANKMRWEVINTTGNPYETITTTTALQTGTWYHVVGTFNGSNSYIYLNGAQEATTALTNSPTSMDVSFIIGQYAGFCNAKIAVARFYNRVLAPTEITQNYNAQKSRFGY